MKQLDSELNLKEGLANMTNNTLLMLTAVITSCTTLVVLCVNTFSSQRKMLTDSVTKNRMKWIEDVRLLMHEFIVEYIKPSCDPMRLLEVKAKIDLYIRFDSVAYDDLKRELDYCTKNEYKDETQYERYMIVCQKTLNDVWVRIKIESGMEKRADVTIFKKVFK